MAVMGHYQQNVTHHEARAYGVAINRMIFYRAVFREMALASGEVACCVCIYLRGNVSR